MIASKITAAEVKATGAESWDCTRANIIKFRHLWKVENFSCFPKERTSPVFSANGCSSRKWQMYILKKDTHIYLELRFVSRDKSPFKYNWKSFILDNKGKLGHSAGGEEEHDIPQSPILCSNKFIGNDVLHDVSKGLLPNDTLSVVCEISMVIDKVDIVCTGEPADLKLLHTEQHADLSQLLETGKFSDVTLEVNGEDIKAHKNILSLRSEVFAAMFDHEMMAENKTNRVVITDFSHNVIRELLTYMYSDKSPNIDEMAEELLTAADKYALASLKIKCESVLVDSLTIDTALQTYILAERHYAHHLKAQSLNVIIANLSAISKTNEWQNMIANYSHLVTEIVGYIASK